MNTCHLMSVQLWNVHLSNFDDVEKLICTLSHFLSRFQSQRLQWTLKKHMKSRVCCCLRKNNNITCIKKRLSWSNFGLLFTFGLLFSKFSGVLLKAKNHMIVKARRDMWVNCCQKRLFSIIFCGDCERCEVHLTRLIQIYRRKTAIVPNRFG